METQEQLIENLKYAYECLQRDGRILINSYKYNDVIEVTTTKQFIDIISAESKLTKKQIKDLVIG